MVKIPRYSLEYIEKTETVQDSAVIRKRISSYYQNNIHYEKFYYSDVRSRSVEKKSYDFFIAKLIEQHLGISVPQFSGSYSIVYRTTELMQNCTLIQFLDIISVVSSTISKCANDGDLYNQWVNFVEQVFREENSFFRIDSDGIVRPYVDKEFSQGYRSSLSLLDNDRYDHIRGIYKHAYDALRSDKSNTRVAMKDIFESIESLCKIMNSRIKGLNSKEITKYIEPICTELISDEDEKNYIKQMLSSMKKWIDAHHIYRHGQGKEEYSPPSLNAAILSLSTGSSYLRFLLEMDQLKVRCTKRE